MSTSNELLELDIILDGPFGLVTIRYWQIMTARITYSLEMTALLHVVLDVR